MLWAEAIIRTGFLLLFHPKVPDFIDFEVRLHPIAAPTLDAAVNDALRSAYLADTFEILLVQGGWVESSFLGAPLNSSADACLIVEGIASNSAGKRVESMRTVNKYCIAYRDAFWEGYCEHYRFCAGLPAEPKCPSPDTESFTPDAGRERGLIDGRKAGAAEKAK